MFLKVMLNVLKLHNVHNDLPFLPEKMKIEKIEKLVVNLHETKFFFFQIRNLKQALNHGLVLRKEHGVITFNQKVSLKPFTDMNTDVRKKANFLS